MDDRNSPVLPSPILGIIKLGMYDKKYLLFAILDADLRLMDAFL